jgi:hypothetical protein
MIGRATQDSVDLGWSDQTLSDTPDTVQSSEQPGVPLDNSDDDEPTRVAASAASVVVPESRGDVELPSATPAANALDLIDVADAFDAEDILDEGARVTEPGLAPPPPTSAEIAAAARTAPPITNPPPVELGRAAVAAEPAGAAPAEAPAASTPAPTDAAAAAIAAPAEAPAASIPPPPLASGFVTPPSLAPTAMDWDELGPPSLLATMKRTRPTSAWTGVGLFLAALTFAGGIGVGLGMRPPALPPVPVPAPLPANAAAGSLANASTPAATAQLAPAPAAPSKPPPPFDAHAARTALDDAAKAAETCRATGDPKGTIPTTVTFDASGKVSNVAINSSRYAGTKTARCIAERLGEMRIPEFSGFPESLKKIVNVR